MKPKLACAIKSAADFGVSIQHYNKTENSMHMLTKRPTNNVIRYCATCRIYLDHIRQTSNILHHLICIIHGRGRVEIVNCSSD